MATPHPVIDRQAFTEVIQVPALRVPKQKCQQMMQRFRGHALDKPRLRAMVDDGERKDTKLLLLDSKGMVPGAASATELQPALAALVQAEGLEVLLHSYTSDYTALTAEQVLRKLIPAGVDVPVSFETIGHIAHLNLRDEQLPYKELIGQVLLDKNAHIRTVVNKVGSIDNEFRVFAMEVIAGEACTETEVVQHGTRFKLDFAQVYWNSRLEAEHERLVRTFQRGDIIADVMAGIGPFAVPAAQKGCTVYANDLNPNSVRYLAINSRINRVTGSTHIFNMDGRAFIHLLCGDASAAPTPVPGNSTSAHAPAPAMPAAADPTMTSAVALPVPALVGPATASAVAEAAAAAGQSAPSVSVSAAPPAAADIGPVALHSASGIQLPHSQKGSSAGHNKSNSNGNTAAQHTPPPHEPTPSSPLPPTFHPGPPGIVFQHAVMNLPASAIEFLNAFKGAFDPDTWRGRLPLVHCYTFMKAPEVEADIIAKAEGYLGGKLDPPPTIHTVRDVAPNKLMLCLSFRVPEAVAFHGRTTSSSTTVADYHTGMAKVNGGSDIAGATGLTTGVATDVAGIAGAKQTAIEVATCDVRQSCGVGSSVTETHMPIATVEGSIGSDVETATVADSTGDASKRRKLGHD